MKNMKLLLGIAALTLFFGAAELQAGDHHHDWLRYYAQSGAAPAGYPDFPVSTIAQAKAMADHVPVAIQGKVVRFLGKDLFEISDGTGSVTAEIDDHFWYAFRPEDTITIYGKVDRKLFGLVIEAHYVVKK